MNLFLANEFKDLGFILKKNTGLSILLEHDSGLLLSFDSNGNWGLEHKDEDWSETGNTSDMSEIHKILKEYNINSI